MEFGPTFKHKMFQLILSPMYYLLQIDHYIKLKRLLNANRFTHIFDFNVIRFQISFRDQMLHE